MENNGRLLFNIDNLQVSIIVEKYNKDFTCWNIILSENLLIKHFWYNNDTVFYYCERYLKLKLICKILWMIWILLNLHIFIDQICKEKIGRGSPNKENKSNAYWYGCHFWNLLVPHKPYQSFIRLFGFR